MNKKVVFPRGSFQTGLVVVCVAFCLMIGSANAQAFRYMDESGNIHFVDTIQEIPPRYRDQVLLPTPAPTGKVKRQKTPKVKPTRTPKPTKTPRPKKQKKNRTGGFFPDSSPGRFPEKQQPQPNQQVTIAAPPPAAPASPPARP